MHKIGESDAYLIIQNNNIYLYTYIIYKVFGQYSSVNTKVFRCIYFNNEFFMWSTDTKKHYNKG